MPIKTKEFTAKVLYLLCYVQYQRLAHEYDDVLTQVESKTLTEQLNAQVCFTYKLHTLKNGLTMHKVQRYITMAFILDLIQQLYVKLAA